MSPNELLGPALADAVRELVRQEVRAALEAEPRDYSVVNSSAEYLTIADAARLASVHPATVREWLREGRLRRHMAGRRPRVKAAELRALLEAKGAEPVSLAARANAIRSKVEG